jgi:putative DNA primase/helicase
VPTVLDVAQTWQLAGVSVIPIQANPTKRPAVSWSLFMERIASSDNVYEWWHGSDFGLALICGQVSGGLEMCEIEGRALADSGALLHIISVMDDGGAGGVWDLLTGPNGYAEDSPSGGMHLIYRISDHPVPGNTKIAADENRLVVAETRGEGGYVIVAPTPGHCHPSGEPWRLVNGNYGQIPTITWAERNLLHECLRLALDKTPPVEPRPVVTVSADGMGDATIASLMNLTPGDDFEQRVDWEEILGPHGWRVTMSMTDGERHWVRPGKEARDGMSATTGRANDRDRLYVFSTSTIFESEVPYTKFGAYALLNHGGDHSLAASSLARKGFGTRRSMMDTKDVAEWVPPGLDPIGDYTEDDIGNATLLASRIRGRYRYIWQDKQYYRWDTTRWVPDNETKIVQEWIQVTQDMVEAGRDKWATKCRGGGHTKLAIELARSMELTFSATDWAPNRDLINVRNGVLNPKTLEFMEHDPKFLMVHLFGTSYIPGATCARFERFMADAVPDPTMRSYVQRALGYSMLGDADQRSIFLIYGPSGTGKSTLIDTIRSIFGDYGATATSGVFHAKDSTGGPSPDLHALIGCRFVTTSETAENAVFDEDLLKRLSGRDQITSRALYGKPVEWTPECVLWIATNNPPKFNSDDNAIWRRVKLVPFTTVFQGETEVPDYARRHLVPEGPGILNWLLEGLRQYQEGGLDTPDEVIALAIEQRNESDSVARFLQDRMADGQLQIGEGHRVECQYLFDQYLAWARQVGERGGGLGNRRFAHRLVSLVMPLQRRTVPGARATWEGISYRAAGTWLTTPPNLFQD